MSQDPNTNPAAPAAVPATTGNTTNPVPKQHWVWVKWVRRRLWTAQALAIVLTIILLIIVCPMMWSAYFGNNKEIADKTEKEHVIPVEPRLDTLVVDVHPKVEAPTEPKKDASVAGTSSTMETPTTHPLTPGVEEKPSTLVATTVTTAEQPKKWTPTEGPPRSFDDMIIFANPLPEGEKYYYVYFFNDEGVAGEPIMTEDFPYFVDVEEPERRLWTYTNGKQEISFRVRDGHEMASAPELYENGTPKEFPQVVPVKNKNEKKFRTGYVGISYTNSKGNPVTYISPCIERFLITTSPRTDLQWKSSTPETPPTKAESTEVKEDVKKPEVTPETPAATEPTVEKEVVSEWHELNREVGENGNFYLVLTYESGKECVMPLPGSAQVFTRTVSEKGRPSSLDVKIERENVSTQVKNVVRATTRATDPSSPPPQQRRGWKIEK